MRIRLCFILVFLLISLSAFAGDVQIFGGQVGMIDARPKAKGLVKNNTNKPVMVKVKCDFTTQDGERKSETFYAANGDEIPPGKSMLFEQILFASTAESGELSVDELVYALSDAEKSDSKFSVVSKTNKSIASTLAQNEKRIIKHFKFLDDHGFAYVVGEIENTLDYPCMIELEAVARNSSGEVVDVDRFYPAGRKILRPGQKSAFKSYVTRNSSAKKVELSVFKITPE